MSNGRPPTSHDVASLAGVSQSTVSLVFRGAASGRVSERTQRAVVDAARQLGFRPNADARRLRTGGPPMVLIAIPDIVNPFFARVFTGARAAAREAGFQVVLSVQRDLDSVAADVTGQRIDAVLACSLQDGGRPLEDPVPAVVLDAEPPQGQSSVRFDIAPALTELVDHLHRLGHRSIAHLRSEVRTATFRERTEAVDAACARRGMNRMPVASALNIDAAREAATALLPAPAGSGGCPPFTAVVCDDDVLSVGVYKAAQDRGLSVPGDLSVSGIDNVDLATAVTPELTTVDLPGEELGATGMHRLIAHLERGGGSRGGTGGAATTECVRLPARLLIRGSTAPPADPASRG
ncbi:DNA-binding LacI/PurR family transcriptional regulator [Lipingzhangella halophila]|uniref:DNA-binding LacI/PurR family transcriptional regulator n=1 Tax=Lipingzhangella halophila TaxID=1783352 RepID=A0A7W7RGE5_9ACTN|nr:LacI family DNA-binding transcriptional regulator [Lipingzhangella halophila]MBB4931487.1 DNA-binding LacI/PurR family transcriptional regulator [Lipingzhangella halophila]